MKDIRAEIENISDIVPFPSVVAQIMTELHKGEIATEKIVHLIETDAVLTTRILRAANSSYYGLRWKIINISHAVMLLGFEEIGRMVLMYQMKQKMFSLNPDQKQFLQQLWKHSVSTAAIARLLAQYVNYRSSGEEFTAGLLHDMGKIVIVQYFPDTIPLTQQMIVELGMKDVEAELVSLAITHEEIGGMLGEKWNLPKIFIEVMRNHHNLRDTQDNLTLVALVRFADLLSEKWSYGIKEQKDECVLEDDESWKTMKIIFPYLGEIQTDVLEEELKSQFSKNQDFVHMFI